MRGAVRTVIFPEGLADSAGMCSHRNPRAFGGLAFALEDLFEALVAFRDVFAGAFAGEWREEQAETATFEVEFECDLRPRAAVEWFDGDGAGGADGAVDASEGTRVGRIVRCDLVGDVAWAAGQLAFVCRAGADMRRALGLDVNADELFLPFAVLAEIVDVGEDVFGAAVDLDAVNDWCHLRVLLSVDRWRRWRPPYWLDYQYD